MVDNRSNGKSETNKKLRQIARLNLNSTREETQAATGLVVREPTLNVLKKTGFIFERNRPTIRKNFDYNMLATNRLPDIEPTVPPESYLHWRYMNKRGSSNTSFDKCNLELKRRAQNAINNFENKIKTDERRMKQAKAYVKLQNKLYLEKV
jgi:hypothetical protein